MFFLRYSALHLSGTLKNLDTDLAIRIVIWNILLQHYNERIFFA